MNRAEMHRKRRMIEIYRVEKKVMGLRGGDLVSRHNKALKRMIQREAGR